MTDGALEEGPTEVESESLVRLEGIGNDSQIVLSGAASWGD